jgi:hypothetical protein
VVRLPRPRRPISVPRRFATERSAGTVRNRTVERCYATSHICAVAPSAINLVPPPGPRLRMASPRPTGRRARGGGIFALFFANCHAPRVSGISARCRISVACSISRPLPWPERVRPLAGKAGSRAAKKPRHALPEGLRFTPSRPC